jgi:hypothetical protein
MTKENTPSAELLTHTVFERHAARTTHRWSFIRLGLWASLAVLVMLILVGAWSYRQTNQMMLESQERTGKAIAAGLSSAVEVDLIVKKLCAAGSALDAGHGWRSDQCRVGSRCQW